MGLRKRTAENREVLCEDKNLSAVYETVTGNNAVTQELLLFQTEVRRPVDDKLVELFKASFVEKKLDTFSSRQFSARLLFFDPSGTAALLGQLGFFLQKFKFAHCTCFGFHRCRSDVTPF